MLVGQERLSPHARVNVGSGWGRSAHVIILECQITNVSVSRAINIFEKRVIPNCVVGVSAGIVKQRKGTESVVVVGACDAVAVIDKRVGSKGGVLCAGAVEQKRRSTTGRIAIRSIEVQGSAANTGVEGAGGIKRERIPTNCCVSSAGSEVEKRMAPFGGGERGVAPVRAW